MAIKLPKWLNPNKGTSQAYTVKDVVGRTMIRQSLVADDGRLHFLDMTPTEVDALILDLVKAREAACDTDPAEYPEDRF